MKVLNLKEAALLVKLHPDTLRKLAKSGAVHCKRVGRGAKQPRYRFLESKLIEWMSQDLPMIDVIDLKIRKAS